MFKRFLTILLLSSVLFYTQALPIQYTFEGTITYMNGSSSDIDWAYDLIIDFDEPGIISNSIVNDEALSPYISWDYGSVEFAEGSESYFSNIDVDLEGVISTTKYAYRYISEYWGYTEYRNNKIFIYTHDYYKNSRSFKLENTVEPNQYSNTSFALGDIFTLKEEIIKNDEKTNLATGLFQITSITDYIPGPQQSVPEPTFITMMASSILMLSMVRLKRKKSPKNR